MKRLITAAVLLLLVIPLSGQTGFSFFPDADDNSERGTVGAGWWTQHHAAAPKSGVTLAYTHPFFIVSVSLDTQEFKPGFILCGPVLAAPAVHFGERKTFSLPVHALIGIAEPSVGRLDYGVAAGPQLLYGKFAVGAKGYFTRHSLAVMLHIGF